MSTRTKTAKLKLLMAEVESTRQQLRETTIELNRLKASDIARGLRRDREQRWAEDPLAAMNLIHKGTIVEYCLPLGDQVTLGCSVCGCFIDSRSNIHDCPTAGPGVPTWWGENRPWVNC